MYRISKKLIVWASVIVAPFATVVVAQFLVPGHVFGIMDQIGLHFAVRLPLLTLLYMAPGFLILFLNGEPSKRRGRIAIYSLLIIFYIPALWLFSLLTACALFENCM